MHGELPEFEEIGIADEISDGFAGGVIEDQSEGPFLGSVLGEKNHRFIKGSIAEGWVGEKELLAEFGRGRLRVHRERVNAGM
jgi:hypothetical protein